MINSLSYNVTSLFVYMTILFISYRRVTKGKQDYLVIGLNAVQKYKFLISQLVSKNPIK